MVPQDNRNLQRWVLWTPGYRNSW